MKKTLIVNYTPRLGSNTKILSDYFKELNQEKTIITILDLAKNPADLLLEENLNLYVKRNFGGQKLTDSEQETMLYNDTLVQQLLDTDYIVLVSPLYNFSTPAAVKGWFDVVISAGTTFEQTPEGPSGLCKNKEAALIITSGSDFNIEPLKSLNCATPLINSCFGLMGIQTHNITAFGLQQYTENANEIIDNAKNDIVSLSAKWY